MTEPPGKKRPSNAGQEFEGQKQTVDSSDRYGVTSTPSIRTYKRVHVTRRDGNLVAYLLPLEGLYYTLGKDRIILRHLKRAWKEFAGVGTFLNEKSRLECWRSVQRAMRRVNQITTGRSRP